MRNEAACAEPSHSQILAKRPSLMVSRWRDGRRLVRNRHRTAAFRVPGATLALSGQWHRLPGAKCPNSLSSGRCLNLPAFCLFGLPLAKDSKLLEEPTSSSTASHAGLLTTPLERPWASPSWGQPRTAA